MGGGMVYGEPCNYGFRQYPYVASRTPVYDSAFAPRRQTCLWGDESSWPEEMANLARKRKLDGVKGEPLGSWKGKNVREIFVEDPSPRSLRTHDVKQATSSSGNSSAPASPSRSQTGNTRPNEKSTVTIPVVFSSEASKEQPVTIFPLEGTKKPRMTFSEEAAALFIQSVFRGHSVRRTQPLQHMRKITSIRSKLREIEQQLSDSSLVQKMRTDTTARLRITEGLMALLFQLDSIQGVHSDVRVWRKAVTKEVVSIQEKVDTFLKGGQALETKPTVAELSVQGDEDTAMASEGCNVAVGDDEVMIEGAPRESLPEGPKVNAEEEIVLDQLKSEDEGGVCHSDDKVVETDECVDAEKDLGEGSMHVDGDNDRQRANLCEPGAEEELREDAERKGESPDEGMDGGWEQISSASHGVDSNKGSDCETVISTRQPMNDDSQVFTEGVERRDDATRRESFESSSLDVKRDASDRWTDAADHTTSHEARDNEDASTIVGMEVDRDEAHPQIHNTECVGTSCEEHDCCFKTCQQAQEKMKDFLKEISSPPPERASPHIPHPSRSNVAEEMDCHGAPGTCSDIEESEGVVNRSVPSTRQQINSRDIGGKTSGWTGNAEHDTLLLKLNEENKMLKSLLLDVMKWNQLQANSMKNVTERLENLEDKLMAKQKKNTSKPKAQRCTRSRLERRLRR